MTDKGIKELSTLTKLQTLSPGRDISDAGLKELANFPQLRSLSLWGNHQVTASGLKELSALKHLQTLYLSQSDVTDTGLKEVASPRGVANTISQ